jgi:phosphohistidine phosphatase
MKRLYVVRHAKSSWEGEALSDFDRPLNERGKRDAPRMGKRLKEKQISPNLMLSSPAKRALSTCKRMAAALNYPETNIKTDRKLYHADGEEILEVIQTIDDKIDVVFIFGHNPGMTDFVNAMTNDQRKYIPNLPTCAVVGFLLEVDSWRKLEFGNARMEFFDYPKSNDD